MVRQTFQLARCGCTLRVTPQTLYSPEAEYITPTHTKSIKNKLYKFVFTISLITVNKQNKMRSLQYLSHDCEIVIQDYRIVPRCRSSYFINYGLIYCLVYPDVVYLAGNFCFANRKHFCFLIFQLCVIKIYR